MKKAYTIYDLWIYSNILSINGGEDSESHCALSLRGAWRRSNLGGDNRDCHAEFTLSVGEILRLRLRMTKGKGL